MEANDGKPSSFVIEAPATRFTGDSPEASIDEAITMELPFRILDPGIADAPTLVYTEPTATPADIADGNLSQLRPWYAHHHLDPVAGVGRIWSACHKA